MNYYYHDYHDNYYFYFSITGSLTGYLWVKKCNRGLLLKLINISYHFLTFIDTATNQLSKKYNRQFNQH